MSEFVKSRLTVVFIDWDGPGTKNALPGAIINALHAFAACERVGICLNKVIEHYAHG